MCVRVCVLSRRVYVIEIGNELYRRRTMSSMHVNVFDSGLNLGTGGVDLDPESVDSGPGGVALGVLT